VVYNLFVNSDKEFKTVKAELSGPGDQVLFACFCLQPQLK